MLRSLSRLILVPLGFVLGTAAALFILGTLGLEKLTVALQRKGLDVAAIEQLWLIVRDARGLATAAALVPPILVIIIGEVARIRASTFYMVGGGASLAALPLLVRSGSFGADLANIGLIWQVFATAGFVGGFVYWLVAGRSA